MGLFPGFLCHHTDLYFLFCAQVPYCLMTIALLYSLESGNLIPPTPFFFLKIVLASQVAQ